MPPNNCDFWATFYGPHYVCTQSGGVLSDMYLGLGLKVWFQFFVRLWRRYPRKHTPAAPEIEEYNDSLLSRLWNNTLPPQKVTSAPSLTIFSKRSKTHLFNRSSTKTSLMPAQ